MPLIFALSSRDVHSNAVASGSFAWISVVRPTLLTITSSFVPLWLGSIKLEGRHRDVRTTILAEFVGEIDKKRPPGTPPFLRQMVSINDWLPADQELAIAEETQTGKEGEDSEEPEEKKEETKEETEEERERKKRFWSRCVSGLGCTYIALGITIITVFGNHFQTAQNFCQSDQAKSQYPELNLFNFCEIKVCVHTEKLFYDFCTHAMSRQPPRLMQSSTCIMTMSTFPTMFESRSFTLNTSLEVYHGGHGQVLVA